MDKDEAKRKHILDEATTELGETLPPMLWGMYNGLVSEGFDKDQAMYLTEAYMAMLTGYSVE